METTTLITIISNNDNYRIVQISNNRIQFFFIQNSTIMKTVNLEIGIHSITSKYFIHFVPNEAEGEYAINNIEDELMSNRELVNTSETLYTNDQFIIDIIQVPKNSIASFSRQAIEEIFTKYALLSMGRSPVYDDIAMDKEKYAGLLILREILHHLNFKEICVINS